MSPIESLFNEGQVNENCTFCWGGGESTILPEFNDLTRLICDRGHPQVLNTNGTVFSEAWAYVVSKDERTYFNISVDSGTAETYLKVKGVDRFDQVWENIKEYLAAAKHKCCFRVKYIVMAGNREHIELENFIEKCLDAGVQAIEYSIDGGEIQAGLSEETIAAVAYFYKE
jgi:MoaA/NifB/PqqE/SkfB family radical SAM enzyme